MEFVDYDPSTCSRRPYPELNDTYPPIPPIRADYAYDPHDERLLPAVPKRMDKPAGDTPIEHHEMAAETEGSDSDSSLDFNQYATKKTIGHGFFSFALITSNAMQLRTLVIQKQRDAIWLISLILVCLSILIQLVLGYVLVFLGKRNIQTSQKQAKLERYNNIALFLTMLISMINVIINVFMSTTNPNTFIDTSQLESMVNGN